MKYCFALLLLITIGARGQDTLVFNSGNLYAVQIESTNGAEIFYRKYGTADTTLYTVPLTFIERVYYQPRPADSLTLPPAPVPLPADAKSAEEMYLEGERDAKAYYSPPPGLFSGTLCGGFFLGPVLGLIPPIATTSSPIPNSALLYPNETKMANKDYRNGYITRAQRKKSQRAWTGYGVGVGSSLVMGLLILAATVAGR